MIIHRFAIGLNAFKPEVSRTLLVLSFLILSIAFSLSADETSKDEFYISEIQSLENSLFTHSQNQETEKKLARVYLEYSDFLVREKRYQEAKDYLEMAGGLGGDPGKIANLESRLSANLGKSEKPRQKILDIPASKEKSHEGFLISKAVAYERLEDGVNAYKEKNYALAEELVGQVLKQDPSNKYAHELLGDIYYQTQKLGQAKASWESSIMSENMERVGKKLEKLSREMPVEKELESTEEEHFMIRYSASQKEYTSYQLKTLLREAYREAYQNFGTALAGKVVVLLYDPGDFNRSIKIQHWSGALFDGKIRIPFSKGAEASQDLKKLIWHELAHVFIYEIGSDKAPLWMHEGIAQFMEDQVTPVNIDYFRNAVIGEKTFSLGDLALGDKLFTDDSSVLLFYQQSFLVMKYLIGQYGFYKVREILKNIGQGESFESALDLVLNLSPEVLEKHWWVWLRKSL